MPWLENCQGNSTISTGLRKRPRLCRGQGQLALRRVACSHVDATRLVRRLRSHSHRRWQCRTVMPSAQKGPTWTSPQQQRTSANCLTSKRARLSSGISALIRAPSSGLRRRRRSTLIHLRTFHCFEDLRKFPLFEDEWLRGGPVRRWVPQPYQDKPLYVFETGGTTGVPKSRVVMEDHWIDYEVFSDTLPTEFFPRGSNWLMLGPSGPRRLRLAVEHLCQHRGGICFCVDLDPRWVVKLLKKGRTKEAKEYGEHVIDQAVTVLSAGHEIQCLFTTPKLLEALALRLMDEGTSIEESGIRGIFCGGTEFTQQWYRFAREELLGPNVYITPTYGNTLMGLACGKPFDPADNYKITYYAPQPRAVVEVVDFDDHKQVVDYDQTGRVKLYTLTKEIFHTRISRTRRR